MADTSTTDPADQDPISQTATMSNALNFKTFVDTQMQYNNIALGNAISNQQHMNSFAQALLARCTNMLLDPSNTSVSDAVLDQQAIKTAQTTPPTYQDPSTSIAALAAQVSALTQIVQGLSIAPAATAKA
jgi:hypothetical protein